MRAWALAVCVLVSLAGCAGGPDPVPGRVALAARSYDVRPDAFVGLDVALRGAVTRGQLSGASLAVGRDGDVIYQYAVGDADPFSPGLQPLGIETPFDAASLAKPMASAAAAALLACEGWLDLDATTAQGVSLGDLLRHTARAPTVLSWSDLDAARAGANGFADAVGRVVEPRPAGDVTFFSYSNPGYLLAGAMVEEAAGTSLGAYLRPRLWGPLGMSHTGYPGPLPPGSRPVPARAAADVDPGRPMDPVADYVLRRVEGHDPGHSGLFTTPADAVRFTQALLNPGASPVPAMPCVAGLLLDGAVEYPVLDAPGDLETGGLDAGGEVLRVGARRVRRGLAFIESADGTLNHTAYTGAVLWLDPGTGLSCALFTTGAQGEPAAWAPLAAEVVGLLQRADLRAPEPVTSKERMFP